MMVTLATGAEAIAIASWIGAAAAVAGTATSIMSAQAANARADRAARNARLKAAQEKLAQDAAASQQRSLAARRLATQVDSSRVIAGAAGVSGGASQMVLESSFATAAKADLAMIDQNRARGTLSTDLNLDNNLLGIDGNRINPFAAGVSGVANGIGMYTSISDGIGQLTAGQATSGEMQFAGTNTNPTANPANPAGVIV